MKPEHYVVPKKYCANCNYSDEQIGAKCFKHDFWPIPQGLCSDWKERNFYNKGDSQCQ